MSKLSDWFGRRKKKKRRSSPTWQGRNVVIYQLTEPSHHLTREPELLRQNVVENESNRSENSQPIRFQPAPKSILLPKTQFNENEPVDGNTNIPQNKTVCANRLSLIEPVEPTGRKMSSGRLSVLAPLSQTGQAYEQRRVSRVLDAPEVQQRKLSCLQTGPETRFSLLDPKDIKLTRPSVVQHEMGPGPSKQVRLSVVKPVEVNEYNKTGRLSLGKPPDGTEGFPLNASHQPVVYAVRRNSIKQPVSQQLFSIKKMFTRKRDEEREDRVQERQTDQTVYAVPATPTRGRTTSVLHQSVKTLTSKNDESPVARKNIRYSMDTDVFSADVGRRRNERPVSPGFVTMERGQGMLVSELLNPITSIFVSDLKDPVPKDPSSRPQEYNNWVRPRQNSMRQVVTPTPQKSNRQANVSARAATMTASKAQMKTKQKQQYSRYVTEDDESSSYSDESEESYDPRSKYYKKPVQHRVYAAEMPDMILPEVAYEMEADKDLAVDTTSVSPPRSKHLRSSGREEEQEINLLQPPGRLSLAQKKDIVGTLDYLCRLPATTSATGSGSTMQWRMDVEKDNENESYNKNK